MTRPNTSVLLDELELLGLNPSQARLLVALLQLNSGTPPEVGEVAGLPRTSVYPLLEELSALGVAHRVSGPGPAVWKPAGRDEVVDVLIEAKRARLDEHKEQLERVRQSLAKTFPDAPSASLYHLQLIKGMAHVQRSYARMVTEAQHELALFVRFPYTWTLVQPKPGIMAAISRGVDVRVIYRTEEWEGESKKALRAAARASHEAGTSARVAEEVPVELVVADRRLALVAMNLEKSAVGGHPLTLWIENPGYANIHADAFDRRWATARPAR